jgi:hypothetical protein
MRRVSLYNMIADLLADTSHDRVSAHAPTTSRSFSVPHPSCAVQHVQVSKSCTFRLAGCLIQPAHQIPDARPAHRRRRAQPLSLAGHRRPTRKLRAQPRLPRHAAAGEVRLRLVPRPDPAHFAEGADPLVSRGLPWAIPFLATARTHVPSSMPRIRAARAIRPGWLLRVRSPRPQPFHSGAPNQAAPDTIAHASSHGGRAPAALARHGRCVTTVSARRADTGLLQPAVSHATRGSGGARARGGTEH